MSKLKKYRTIRALRLRLYRDETGKRYYRWRESHIKRIPRWFPGRRAMRWIMVIAVLVIAGSIAYPPVMKYASDKVIEKVADQLFTEKELADLTQDPSVQKIMEQLQLGHVDDGVGIPASGPIAMDTGVSDGDSPNSKLGADTKSLAIEEMSFSTNEEALKFLLKKFTMSELKSLASKAQGGLSTEEKKEIKAIVTERLTQTEFDSLKIIAAMEIQRRQGNLIIEP